MRHTTTLQEEDGEEATPVSLCLQVPCKHCQGDVSQYTQIVASIIYALFVTTDQIKQANYYIEYGNLVSKMLEYR